MSEWVLAALSKFFGSATYTAHAAAFSSQLIFAGWNIIGTLVLREDAGPLLWILIRNVGALVLFAGMSWRQQQQYRNRISSQEMFWLPRREHAMEVLLFGMVSGVAMPFFYLNGLKLTTATLGAIYDGPLMPVFCSAMTLVLGIEHLAPGWGAVQQVASIVLSAVGAVVLVLNTSIAHHEADHVITEAGKTTDTQTAFFLGNVFLLLECLCMAALLILQKPLLQHYSETNTLLWVAASGTGFTVVMVACSSGGGISGAIMQLTELLCTSRIMFSAAVYLVAVEATLAYVFLSYANATLSSSSVALWGCSQPVSTCILAFMVLGDSMNLLQILGACGVILGLAWNVSVPKHDDMHFEYEAVSTQLQTEPTPPCMPDTLAAAPSPL